MCTDYPGGPVILTGMHPLVAFFTMAGIPLSSGATSTPTEPAELTGLAGWVVQVMEALGAVGAGLLIALENLFPPLPSEAILPLAGFAASRGDLSLAGALIFTTLGSVVGALALYGVGVAIGLQRIRRIAEKMPLVKVKDVDKTMEWFHRHGYKAVFFGRMIPIFRSLISIPAGVEKMPLLPFLVLTTLGSAIWNTIFVLAGFYLGENWHVIEDYVGVFQRIVILVVAVLLAWWLVQRVRSIRTKSRNRRSHTADARGDLSTDNQPGTTADNTDNTRE